MANEGRHIESGRSLSPYHQKCFPPYCDGAIPDKQAVSKMTREELEDRYIIYSDENLALKRRLKDHEKQLQRLHTALTRQDNKDKKEGAKVTAATYYGSSQIDNLEAENKHLQAKVKVLKQQLMNHSYIHCKDHKIAESKDRHTRDSIYADCAPRIQSAREGKSPSAREGNAVKALKERNTVLEDLLQSQKMKYEDKIRKLEKELANKTAHSNLQEKISQTSKQVNDNKEIIRLRRLGEDQSGEIHKLGKIIEADNSELEELREALKTAAANAEEIQEELEKEREKLRSALAQLAAGSSNSEIVRSLEEQILDLQKEKQELKDVNEKLLQISSVPQSKSDRTLHERVLKKQISALELNLKEKNKELSDKEGELIKLQRLVAEKESEPSLKSVSSQKSLRTFQMELEKENENLSNHLEMVEQSKAEELLALNTKLLAAQEEITTLKEQQLLPDPEIEKLREENNELQRKLDKTLKEIEANKGISSGLEDAIEKLKKENNELQRKLEETTNNAVSKNEDEIEKLKEENNELQRKLDKTLKEIEAHKGICSGLEDLKVENEELKKTLDDALQKIHSLKEHGDAKEKEIIHLKEEIEALHKQLSDNVVELTALKQIAAEHEHCCKCPSLTEVPSKSTTIASVQPVPSKRTTIAPTQPSSDVFPSTAGICDDECEVSPPGPITFRRPITPVASKYTLAPVQSKPSPILKVVSASPSKYTSLVPEQTTQIGRLKKENEELKDTLANVERELSLLRDVAAEHEQCLLSKPSTPFSPRLSKRKWPDPKTVIAMGNKKISWEVSSTENVPNTVAHKSSDQSKLSSPQSDVAEQLPPLTSSLLRVQRVLMERRYQPENLSHVSDEQGKTPSSPPSQHSLQKQLSAHGQLSRLTVPSHHKTQTSRLSQPSFHSKPSKRTLLSEQCEVTEPVLQRSQHSHPSQLSVYSKASSLITVSEPPHKPMVLVVAKHEFQDALEKEAGRTMSPDATTDDCILDIGIHAVEMDIPLRDYLTNEYETLYLRWKFLGLSEKTHPSPVNVAEYKMKVTYCGPRSPQLCDHINKKPVSLILMGKNSRGEKKLGKGYLDMSPVLSQPGRKFFRCVPVETSHGHGKIYCSFKMHGECCGEPYCPNGSECPGCEHEDCPRRVMLKEYLEVGIGRLHLDNFDFPTNSKHPHIYVEYCILGYCGEALETESEPKGDVLHYNHVKRLKITNNNVKNLEAMLRPDNTVPLSFVVLTEPCDLSADNEVEEIGWANVDLREEMLHKNQNIISAQVPVFDKFGEPRGSLSVTVLGIETVRRHGGN